ncbi:hypothetical protein [Streptomyces pseudovenezuelae]|uniref:hypothetical protein n=1 Tax=Streptomyces pseudovenezuelae TaxID=67350 RepID=UPI002E3721AC|nr:hypothetical protein [Streptomyces pseudovenezuelae]
MRTRARPRAGTRLRLDHTGRCLDKRHWISLGPGPGTTGRLITEAVEDSYDLVAERLPRRDRPSAR